MTKNTRIKILKKNSIHKYVLNPKQIGYQNQKYNSPQPIKQLFIINNITKYCY